MYVKQEHQNTLSDNHWECFSKAVTNKDWCPEHAEECFVDHWSLLDLEVAARWQQSEQQAMSD